MVLAFLLVLLTVALSNLTPGAGGRISFYWALALCVCTIGWIAWAEYRRTFDATNPLCLTMLALAILFPLHGWMTHDHPFAYRLLGVETHQYFTYALMVVTAGCLAIAVGFRSRGAAWFARRIPRIGRPVEDHDPLLLSKLAVLYLVAVACRYLIWIDGQHFHNYSIRQSMGKGTLSSLAFLLDTVQSFAPLVMLVLVGTGLVMRRRRRIMVGMFLFGIEVTWGLTSGSRAKMLIPLFLLVVVLGRVWRPIRLRHVIVGAVLLVFLLFPLVTAFRTAFEQQRYGASRTGITTSMIAEALTDSFTTEASIYVSAERLTPMQLFSHRLHGLSSLASIMRYTPERHEYLMGEHWVTAPMQLIVPRFVWRDKPVVGRLSSIFRERYWKQVRDSNTSIAVTLFGDFWINFHMLGVLLGGFFIGVFLRYLYNFLQIGAGANSVVCHAVYATMLVPSLLYSEKLVDQLLTGMPKIALILWLGTLFLAPRARFSPPPAHSRVQGSSVA